MSKVTTRGLEMWCWGTWVHWRWGGFVSLMKHDAPDHTLYILSSSGVHQLPTETRWGVNRAGESYQEAEESGDRLQGVWAAEGLLPAPQHVPPQAHPASHALQAHPGAIVQTLSSRAPRSRRLQGSALISVVCIVNSICRSLMWNSVKTFICTEITRAPQLFLVNSYLGLCLQRLWRKSLT